MGLFCCGGLLSTFSRAAAKAASARLRRLGLADTQPDWARRASTCEVCHLRVIHKGISYCGTPFLRKPTRVNEEDGCGCPCRDKARDPAEHCPLTRRNLPSGRHTNGRCNCKWCAELESPRRDG